MNAKTKSIVKIIVLVGILVALVAAALLIYAHFKDKPIEGQKTIEVTVVFSDTQSETITITTQAEYLKAAIDQDGRITLGGSSSEFGFFITSVNGVEANSDNQEWWAITKSGASTDAIDNTVIADGDKFEITLTIGW